MEDEDNTSDQDASTHSEEVEWLATGREKRTTAGNRLSTLLGQEEKEDDDVNLLFEQEGDEPDEEFEGAESQEDEGGESSSSDEDDGEGGDEMEGEKQLQRAEREQKKAQKRKADTKLTRPRPAIKRVRISEAAPEAEEQAGEVHERKRKRSGRVSWGLESEDAKRTSSRTLSIQNKERTKASLKESEAKRSRQQAVMEAAQKKREAEKRGPMTQEDHLREAAEVERLNSRSLNKWEELEAERIKKQKQKLEALQNRKIEGPLIRWWSGPAVWVGDKITNVGPKAPLAEKIETITAQDDNKTQSELRKDATASDGDTVMTESAPRETQTQAMSVGSSQQPLTKQVSRAPFLDGIEHFASMQEPVEDTKPPPSAPLAKAPGTLMTPYPTGYPGIQPAPGNPFSTSGPSVQQQQMTYPLPPPPKPVKALRSTLTFENFDPVIHRSKEAQIRTVFGTQAKAVQQPLAQACAVTGLRASYKDPLTGLPYYGISEFRRIRRLPGLPREDRPDVEEPKAQWSEILGAWIGTGAHPAHGVPESFLTGKLSSGSGPSSERLPVREEGSAAIKAETDSTAVG